MKKNLVTASAVVLGLAMSGMAFAGGPVVSHSYTQSGLGVGVTNSSALNDMRAYGVDVSFLTAKWMVGAALTGYQSDDTGMALDIAPYFHMVQALSSRWSMMYGVGGTYTYFSDLKKATPTTTPVTKTYTDNPWSASAQAGLAYAWSDNVRVSVVDNLFSYNSDVYGDTSMSFFDSPSLTLSYYFG